MEHGKQGLPKVQKAVSSVTDPFLQTADAPRQYLHPTKSTNLMKAWCQRLIM